MRFLNVPFKEKDKAKALGARWHAASQRWYIPEGLSAEPFALWAEDRPVIRLRPLLIELVPKTAWFTNLRSELSPAEWRACQDFAFSLANHRCDVCSEVGTRHPLECHEEWRYDDQRGIQRLTGLHALCPACHEATHSGLAQLRGHGERANAHLMKINGWTRQELDTHKALAYQHWLIRSRQTWSLDVEWLFESDIPLSERTEAKLSLISSPGPA